MGALAFMFCALMSSNATRKLLPQFAFNCIYVINGSVCKGDWWHLEDQTSPPPLSTATHDVPSSFLLDVKGKFTQKASWSEMKEPTKTRRTPLTVCKYLFLFSRGFILKITVTFWMKTRPKWRHNCSIETNMKFFSAVTQRIMNIAAVNFLR